MDRIQYRFLECREFIAYSMVIHHFSSFKVIESLDTCLIC